MLDRITMKANKIFLAAIVLLIVLKIALVMGQKIFPIPDARVDDGLMYSRAVSITNGNWLGDYNEFTLAKGAFFSLWLAFLNLLSVPLLIGNQILYITSCLFLIWCIKTAIPNKKILSLFFAVLLFNPATYGYYELLRVYRDGLFPTLIIFVFAGIIGMLLNRNKNKKLLLCSCIYGIGLSLAWLTREDTFWILPFVIVATVIIALFIFLVLPYYKHVITAVLLLPMAITQAASLSYDSGVISISVYLISVLLKIHLLDEYQLTKRDAFKIIIIASLIVNIIFNNIFNSSFIKKRKFDLTFNNNHINIKLDFIFINCIVMGVSFLL